MTVLLLGSVSGSPGVTTAAVALAVGWSDPVLLVEADAAGASAVLPGYLGGTSAHLHGVLDAAVAARAGTLAADLPDLLLELPGNPRARLLPGLTRPEQAATMTGAWPVLADALTDLARDTGTDLIIDAGRWSASGAPVDLLPVADQALLVIGSDLPSLHTVRAWLPSLRSRLVDPSRLGLLVVAEARPYTAREIRRHLHCDVVAVLDHDPSGAAVYSHGTPTPRRAGGYPRSIAGLRTTLTRHPTPAGGPR